MSTYAVIKQPRIHPTGEIQQIPIVKRDIDLSHGFYLTQKKSRRSLIFLYLRHLDIYFSCWLSIFDHCVNDVTCFKYLGILISSDFTWSNHVEYMEGKINRRLGLHGALLSIYYRLGSAGILFYRSLVNGCHALILVRRFSLGWQA